MPEGRQSWQIGSITVTPIFEVDAAGVIGQILPDATRENITKIPWLTPHFADSEGRLKAVVQAFVIKTNEFCLIVDTWHKKR